MRLAYRSRFALALCVLGALHFPCVAAKPTEKLRQPDVNIRVETGPNAMTCGTDYLCKIVAIKVPVDVQAVADEIDHNDEADSDRVTSADESEQSYFEEDDNGTGYSGDESFNDEHDLSNSDEESVLEIDYTDSEGNEQTDRLQLTNALTAQTASLRLKSASRKESQEAEQPLQTPAGTSSIFEATSAAQANTDQTDMLTTADKNQKTLDIKTIPLDYAPETDNTLSEDDDNRASTLGVLFGGSETTEDNQKTITTIPTALTSEDEAPEQLEVTQHVDETEIKEASNDTQGLSTDELQKDRTNVGVTEISTASNDIPLGTVAMTTETSGFGGSEILTSDINDNDVTLNQSLNEPLVTSVATTIPTETTQPETTTSISDTTDNKELIADNQKERDLLDLMEAGLLYPTSDQNFETTLTEEHDTVSEDEKEVEKGKEITTTGDDTMASNDIIDTSDNTSAPDPMIPSPNIELSDDEALQVKVEVVEEPTLIGTNVQSSGDNAELELETAEKPRTLGANAKLSDDEMEKLAVKDTQEPTTTNLDVKLSDDEMEKLAVKRTQEPSALSSAVQTTENDDELDIIGTQEPTKLSSTVQATVNDDDEHDDKDAEQLTTVLAENVDVPMDSTTTTTEGSMAVTESEVNDLDEASALKKIDDNKDATRKASDSATTNVTNAQPLVQQMTDDLTIGDDQTDEMLSDGEPDMATKLSKDATSTDQRMDSVAKMSIATSTTANELQDGQRDMDSTEGKQTVTTEEKEAIVDIKDGTDDLEAHDTTRNSDDTSMPNVQTEVQSSANAVLNADDTDEMEAEPERRATDAATTGSAQTTLETKEQTESVLQPQPVQKAVTRKADDATSDTLAIEDSEAKALNTDHSTMDQTDSPAITSTDTTAALQKEKTAAIDAAEEHMTEEKEIEVQETTQQPSNTRSDIPMDSADEKTVQKDEKEAIDGDDRVPSESSNPIERDTSATKERSDTSTRQEGQPTSTAQKEVTSSSTITQQQTDTPRDATAGELRKKTVPQMTNAPPDPTTYPQLDNQADGKGVVLGRKTSLNAPPQVIPAGNTAELQDADYDPFTAPPEAPKTVVGGNRSESQIAEMAAKEQ